MCKRWHIRRRSADANDTNSSLSSPTIEESSQNSKFPTRGLPSTFVSEEDSLVARNELQYEQIQQSHSVDPLNQVTAEVVALDKSGTDFYTQGNYEQAFLRFERALALKRRSLADHSLAWKKYEEAEAAKRQTSIPIVSGETADKSFDISVPSQAPQSLLILQSHPTYKATQTVGFKRARNDKDDEYSRNLVASVATSINNLTFLKQQNGQCSNEETLASYMQCLQMKLEVLGPNHLSVGKTLNNIGSVLYVQGNYASSLQAYLDAYRIMEAELGLDHLDVATVASNIGDAYRRIGSSDDKALMYYRLALEIRWKLLPSNHPKISRLMEQTASLELKQGENSLLSPSRHNDSDSDESAAGALDESERTSYEEDVKFIEELERRATLEMAADKETVIRELKELLVVLDDDVSVDSSNQKPTPQDEVSSNLSKRDDANSGHPKINKKDTVTVEEHTFDTGDLNGHFPTNGSKESMILISESELANGDITFAAESTLTSRSHYFSSVIPQGMYSVEERRRALFAVKERLARLRERRGRLNYDVRKQECVLST